LVNDIHLRLLFIYTVTALPQIYTLSLHDALPIYELPALPKGFAWLHERIALPEALRIGLGGAIATSPSSAAADAGVPKGCRRVADRKSTRLNSSHVSISYAVFCLKKKKETYVT